MRFAHMMGILALATLFCFALQDASAHAAGSDVSNGEAQMLVRGPDAKPLANAKLQIVSLDHTFGSEKPHEVAATTDNNGLARFPWPAKSTQMKVSVAGVGYGLTGLTDIRPRERTTVALATRTIR